MGIKSYIFGRTKFIPVVNTFIGGVASTIGTASLLAAKLNIAVSRISLFSVVGSDIQCSISGNYIVLQDIFQGSSQLTYFDDQDGLVNAMVLHPFRNSTKIKNLFFKGLLQCDNFSFANINGDFLEKIYIPNCNLLGTSNLNNGVFNAIRQGAIIYVNPFLQTNNAGGADGDLVAAISRGAIVRYVTNFTAPNPVTNLAAGTIYNTAIQLNFTAPTGSTNAIEFYEVFANGIFNRIITSGQYIVGLTSNTSYNLTVVAVDVLYNKSVVNNILVVSTSNVVYNDADANAYISASTLTNAIDLESTQILVTGLKDNLLWGKIQALYLFKGSTASQHRFNAKNPLDTNAAFRLLFSGTGTHSALGYAGNGTNAFANTNFIPSANQNVNSNGLTIVVGTNNTAASSDVFEIGAYSNDSQVSGLAVKADNTTFRRISIFNNNPPRITINGTNEARGIFTGTRINAVQKLSRNGTLIASAIGNGTLPTVPIYIAALNVTTSVYGASNQRIQIAIIHEGLSDAEVATLHSIIDISETIAGRKTW